MRIPLAKRRLPVVAEGRACLPAGRQAGRRAGAGLPAEFHKKTPACYLYPSTKRQRKDEKMAVISGAGLIFDMILIVGGAIFLAVFAAGVAYACLDSSFLDAKTGAAEVATAYEFPENYFAVKLMMGGKTECLFIDKDIFCGIADALRMRGNCRVSVEYTVGRFSKDILIKRVKKVI